MDFHRALRRGCTLIIRFWIFGRAVESESVSSDNLHIFSSAAPRVTQRLGMPRNQVCITVSHFLEPRCR